MAGDHLSLSISSYIRDQFKIYVGEKTAEAKIALSSVMEARNNNEMVVRGRDVMTGLPREVIITARDIHDAIENQVDIIVESTRVVLEKHLQKCWLILCSAVFISQVEGP